MQKEEEKDGTEERERLFGSTFLKRDDREKEKLSRSYRRRKESSGR